MSKSENRLCGVMMKVDGGGRRIYEDMHSRVQESFCCGFGES